MTPVPTASCDAEAVAGMDGLEREELGRQRSTRRKRPSVRVSGLQWVK
jgi:hypothetical protein